MAYIIYFQVQIFIMPTSQLCTVKSYNPQRNLHVSDMMSHICPLPIFPSVSLYSHCSPAMATSFSHVFAFLSPPLGLGSQTTSAAHSLSKGKPSNDKLHHTKCLVRGNKMLMSSKHCALIKFGQHNLKKEENDTSYKGETLNLSTCVDITALHQGCSRHLWHTNSNQTQNNY